jgi:hypothetical protein
VTLDPKQPATGLPVTNGDGAGHLGEMRSPELTTVLALLLGCGRTDLWPTLEYQDEGVQPEPGTIVAGSGSQGGRSSSAGGARAAARVLSEAEVARRRAAARVSLEAKVARR